MEDVGDVVAGREGIGRVAGAAKDGREGRRVDGRGRFEEKRDDGEEESEEDEEEDEDDEAPDPAATSIEAPKRSFVPSSRRTRAHVRLPSLD